MKGIFFTLIFCASALFALSQESFDEKQTSVSNVRMTINNVGTFGNAMRGSFDVLDYSSAEFPANSGIEHLFEAGIWIGAKVDGSLIAVSTAAYDQTSGYSAGRAGYEFTSDLGAKFTERSTLVDNPNYSLDAVSHQDFVADFSDRNILVPGTQIQITGHDNPMELDVHFEAYNWNYAFSDFMVIANYTVTNTSSQTLEDVYIGMWSNEVVRNINITPPGQGGSAFYDKGGNGFIDSLGLAYCYDATGDAGFTESYVGHKFLGAEVDTGFRHPSLDTSFKINYQTWQFNNVGQPTFFFPSSELQRYEKMRNGLNHLPCWTETGSVNPFCAEFQTQNIQEQINAPGNRSDLVSVGPFKTLGPGESITFAWAWVFGKKNEDGNPNTDNNATQRKNLVDHANWAQTAFNGEDVNFNGKLDDGEDNDGDGKITRYILPTPPDIPETRIVAGDKAIDVYWTANSESSVDPISQIEDFEGYNLYLSTLGFDVSQVANLNEDLKLAASYDLDGNGLFFETGMRAIQLEVPKTFEGDTHVYQYKYTFDNLVNGWQYAVSLTAYDQGDEVNRLESLESSILSNTYRVFPGTEANAGFERYASSSGAVNSLLFRNEQDSVEAYQPFVYPNPYYGGSAFEGSSAFEEDKKIVFANLPETCIIRVFTLSGDLIKTIEHDQNYQGNDVRWFSTYSNPDNTVFSGGEHSWDLLSDNAQIIARGVYLFSVEDATSGKIWKDKFVIVK